MALHHAAPGELIDVTPFGPTLRQAKSVTLVRSDHVEVLRLVIPAGKTIPEHQVAAPITVQCVEGVVEFNADGESRTMHAGSLLYLLGNTPHSLHAREDASVLVTLCFANRAPLSQ